MKYIWPRAPSDWQNMRLKGVDAGWRLPSVSTSGRMVPGMEWSQMGLIKEFVIGLAGDGPSGSGGRDDLRWWAAEGRIGRRYGRRVLKEVEFLGGRRKHQDRTWSCQRSANASGQVSSDGWPSDRTRWVRCTGRVGTIWG